jgi:hypothetical protein
MNFSWKQNEFVPVTYLGSAPVSRTIAWEPKQGETLAWLWEVPAWLWEVPVWLWEVPVWLWEGGDSESDDVALAHLKPPSQDRFIVRN